MAGELPGGAGSLVLPGGGGNNPKPPAPLLLALDFEVLSAPSFFCDKKNEIQKKNSTFK